MPGTLASRLADADEERFVGRRQELCFFDRLFDGDLDVAVVLVSGRAGIGKSTLLREVARRGVRRGYAPRIVEGRDVAPVPGELEGALEGLQHEERPLLLVDTYERMSAVGGYLRQRFLTMLPEGALVVIATRTGPESAWFEGGWERLVHELPLAEMPAEDAVALVTEHGVADERRAAIVAWADGSPLALALAADAATAEPRWEPNRSPDPPEIVRALIRRITAAELDAAHRGAVAVGALARVVTVDLLRDVLPGVDAVEAHEWLASRTFSEPLGDGLTLHDLMRRALRAELRRSDPERERELRRRIADHLYTQAMSGQPRLTIDLADLVENPTIRALYSWDGAAQYRIDGVRPGDAAVVAALLKGRKLPGWWEATRPFFEQAPHTVAIARNADDQLVGYLMRSRPTTRPTSPTTTRCLAPGSSTRARPSLTAT
ncbi:MAG TPA: ATP-binding protein [Solirubrobacteraceae bacterium]|nr:ATP-binding protein [Solirubrobacteraceae bacterium]